MALNVTISYQLDADEDKYRVYEPSEGPSWLDALAQEYVGLRTDCTAPLQDLSYDGLQMDVDDLRERIQRATVPRYVGGNFDVVRSDFGELIAYLLLEEQFGTQIGFKSLLCRELIQQAARGIDCIGIENGPPLTLIITEVKVSNAAQSPPAVVDTDKDSLRKQHLSHLGNRATTVAKIIDRARFIADLPLRDRYLAAALYLESGDEAAVKVVACSVLVRPIERYQRSDFGSFYDRPGDYRPATVRFLIFCVRGDIDAVASEWDQAIQQVSVMT